MQCWQCGADVQPGERTCGYCGARLTSPPAGRSPRSSQQRPPSSRNTSRRARNDGWDDANYGPDYPADDPSTYDAAYRRDDRGGGRKRSRPNSDEDWGEDWGESRGDPRQNRGRPSHGRSSARQESDEYGSYSQAGQPDQPGYDRSDVNGGDYASQEYDAHQPDPLDDPRAPRSLRSTPRREPDPRAGYPPEDPPQRYPRDVRESSRRPPMEPGRGRHDEGTYRGRGYGAEGMPPLTDERQGYSSGDSYGSYAGQGRSRRSQPSSADNRYSRSSASRGQPSPYDDRYVGGRYDDGYDEGYSEQQQASRRGYGRNMAPDEHSSWYQQVGSRARALQQRWGDTIGSMRIPGLSPQEESADKGKSSGRRMVTTVVLLLVLVAAVVGGAVVLAPRFLQRLNPSSPGTTSSLCVPKGAATDSAVPTPTDHFKQYSSSRSHYGVNYPETWTVEPQQKAASGYDYIDVYTLPNSATLVSIEQPQAACALTDSAIIQGEVATAQQQNITFTEDTAAARTQTIGSEQWQRREYDVSQKGVTLHMAILACHHQGRAYVIVLVSRTTTFSQDNTGIFQPMLDSFRFTG